MPDYPLTALIPVTATGLDRAKAADYARTSIDDALAAMDQRTPAADLTTGPATLIDLPALLDKLNSIRQDALSLELGTALTRSVPTRRIRQNTEQALTLLGHTPHDNIPQDGEP